MGLQAGSHAIVRQGTPRTVFSHVGELKSIGLDVPPMTELAKLLRDQGLAVEQDIITTKEMADAICQLLQKK